MNALPLLALATGACGQQDAGPPSQAQADAGLEASAGQGAPSVPTSSAVQRAAGSANSAVGSPDALGARLSVRIEDDMHMALESLVMACPTECVTVTAVATGGYPPYDYAWSDGPVGPRRQVCRFADEPLVVTVTDSGLRGDEFRVSPMEVSATLATRALDCDDEPEPDAGGMPPDKARCQVPEGEPCQLSDGLRLPDEVTVDILGSPQFFVGGAELPAGRYRLAYVDGCNTYGIGASWTVHGLEDLGSFGSCNLIDGNGAHLVRTPGTTGIFVDPQAQATAFATYEECVEANCELPPVDFEFAGGALAVVRDGVFVGSIDDAGGETVGGRSPTFRLTSLDHCP